MKIRILLFLFLMIGISQIHAQVQVKKDKILYDKAEIAIMKSPHRNRWEISTLNGEKKLVVDFKGVSANAENAFQWLEVTTPDRSKISEIPYEVLVTSFSVDRIVAHLLSVKYGIITSKGIDDSAINNFFETYTEKLSDQYTTAIAVAKEQEADRKNKEVEIRNTFYPQVNAAKQVTFTQSGKVKIVGKLVTNKYQVGTISDYIYAYDLDGNLIATMSSTSRMMEYKVKAWDGNEYIYKANRNYSDTNNAFLQEFVIDLISRDYMFGNQIKNEKQNLHKAKVELAVANSINLYDVSGYAVEKSGVKYTGKITAILERLDINQTGEKLPQSGADNYGQTVKIQYKNEKGSMREKTLNAKDDNYFCVNMEDGEKCYYGLKTYGEGMKKLQNLDNLKFNSAYYYLLLKKEKNIMLLQDPVETHKYVIKINSDEKGQMIDNRSEEKLAEKLGEYLVKCPELSKEIKSGALDVKSENNLFQIVEEYSNCFK